jgi:hypothetical protein
MLNEEVNQNLAPTQPAKTPDTATDELAEESPKSNWRAAFRTAFEKARRQKPIEHRKELSRDKSKALVLVVGAGVALLLIFFGVFSSPKKRTSFTGDTPRGQASLGRKVTPGQENSDTVKSVAPLLSADVRATDPATAGQVTPEDVGRTSRTGGAPLLPPATAPAKSNYSQDYALSKVDFSDPAIGQGNNIPYPPAPPAPPTETSESAQDLKKPSLVFVRANETRPTIKPNIPGNDEDTLALAAGTRLVARLQAPVSSAIATPVVAVIEYNYERNGQIALPAGAKVFGKLTQVTSTGYVGIQFTEVEMPDGTAQRIDASAMDLNYGPLKGFVSGKKTGTRFLVRSLTGLGTIASYVVGGQGSSSAGLISANTLMRERLADNIASAGQAQLNSLAFNQNPVVTVPGNTRFYVVVQKPSSNRPATGSGMHSATVNSASVGADRVPTLEELRQLLQLRREINELYSQSNAQSPAQAPQQ